MSARCHFLPRWGVISKAEVSVGPSRGTVLSEEVGSNSFEADVSVERDSLLMLKVTYHPNWRATVDGVETDTVMLMPSFIGVQLPPGGPQGTVGIQAPAFADDLVDLGSADFAVDRTRRDAWRSFF